MCVDGVGKFFCLVRLKLFLVMNLFCVVSCCSSLGITLIVQLIRFPCFPFVPVDLFASNVARRRRHFDLRGVLLHVEFLSAAPQPVSAVCVADVVFDVDV